MKVATKSPPVAAAGKPDTDWTSIDTKIDHSGKKIILPADPSEMTYDAAIETIKRVKKDEEQIFEVFEVIEGAPWDTLVATYKAMQNIYGVVLAGASFGFWGPKLPTMMTVKVGHRPDDVIQIPIGDMTLPGLTEKVSIHMKPVGTIIVSKARKRDRAKLVEIANEARRILRTESVYRGKAIKLRVNDDGDLVMDQEPEFLDLSDVHESDMIHTAETTAMIRTNIFSPIRNTAACRRHKIPLKRGILLEGPYGTGKSLTARVTARVAIDNGWTFIMLDRSQGLKAAINFAKNYQPCVIFAEDIDRAGADRDEDEQVNDLVNLLDGVVGKSSEIMTVLTTNFPERIDRALLRPGRFDALISIQAPDAETVGRLIHFYARNLIGPDVDLKPVGEILAGQIPATVREVVERAKLSMLIEDRTSLSTEDLRVSALGMKRHLALLNPEAKTETPELKLWNAMSELVGRCLDGVDETTVVTRVLAEKILAEVE